MPRDHKGQRPRAGGGGRPSQRPGKAAAEPTKGNREERRPQRPAKAAGRPHTGRDERRSDGPPKSYAAGPRERGKERREERTKDRRDDRSDRPLDRQDKRRPRGVEQLAPSGPSEPMRIAKAMARAGLCSRREAERWIAEGRVSVNGKPLATPAFEVGPHDKIVVDGEPLPEAEGVRLWRYHKPRGLVTTHTDPEGRPTVFDSLPLELPRVISVGRLDYNTEGLLLLTNDGALARYMELPATGWLRRYRVRARGRITQAALDTLKEGISLEGINYGPVEATLDSQQGSNVWLTVGLREGKNREIRKIMGHLGLEVSRLIRVSFGPFQLLDLAPGEVERIRRRMLRDQLGLSISRELGLIEGTEPQNATVDTSKPRKDVKPPRTKGGWKP